MRVYSRTLWRGALVLSVAALLGVAPSAYAVDGVIEINQARVDAAGGFPFVINDPGSYRLTSNLTVRDANTTAIVVSVSEVTLDLNGFSIIGPGTGDRRFDGVNVAEEIANVTVINGTVKGFSGVGVRIGRNSRVENINATENEVGIGVGLNCILLGNMTNENRIGMSLGFNCTVRNNTVSQNRENGIIAPLGSNVSDNSVVGNGEEGIIVGPGSTVLGNAVLDNGDVGLKCIDRIGTRRSTEGGYGTNVFVGNNGGNDQPQVLGCTEIGTNLCGTDTVCP